MSGLALMLPGQGSQFVGMGRDLAEAHPPVREVYEEAEDILETRIARLSFAGPEDELRATQNAQPAILLHSYAVWTLLRPELRGPVLVAAGHSLGEFSAHLLAGTFGFADALRLVRARGELMAESGRDRPGTMTAVLGLDPPAVEEVCRSVGSGTVVPANLNAPGQVVISGDVEAVTEAGLRLSDAGARRVVPLNVSGAFHSPLMELARGGLEAALDDASLGSSSFPIVANATAEPIRAPDQARDTLLAQLTSPVRWTECMERMREYEPDLWLELGPGTVLGGLARRIDRTLETYAVGGVEQVDALLKEGRV